MSASPVPTPKPSTAGKSAGNRRPLLLEIAADLFVRKGFAGTSVRDIAGAAGMLPGSLYYHFASKEVLLIEVFRTGVERISAAVDVALANCEGGPWARLEAASAAHLEALLAPSPYAQVVVRIRPSDVPGAADRLIAMRDGYEARFRSLIAALPLPAGTDRSLLRLMLIGALNEVPLWYRPGGAPPAGIAAAFLAHLRRALEPAQTETGTTGLRHDR